MKSLHWNPQKNIQLIQERGVSFEAVELAIAQGYLLDILKHPNSEKYPNQRIFVIKIDNYAYVVPFVEDNESIFFKTIIPSRKMTRLYLKEEKA
ncbi:MAG: BrnT family toxin [Brasilonema sp.]